MVHTVVPMALGLVDINVAEFDQQRLATVQLVVATPFTESGEEIRTDELNRLIENSYRAGIRVFIPAAGTGEFPSLTADEIVQCVKACRQAAGSNSLLIAPIGHGIHSAIDLGKRLMDAGADALLVMPCTQPYIADEGLRRYYETLIEKVDAPFLFYKRGAFPTDVLLAELAESEKVVGIKYADGDINAFTRFAQRCAKKVALSCGLAERYAPAFMLSGATGYTSGAANVCPRLSLAMHRALAAGDHVQAMHRLTVLRPVEDYRDRGNGSYNISVIKHALNVSGYSFGVPRPPQRQLTLDECEDITRMVTSLVSYEAEMTMER